MTQPDYKINVSKDDLKKAGIKSEDYVLVFQDEVDRLVELLEKYKVDKDLLSQFELNGVKLTDKNSSGFKLQRETLLTDKESLEKLNTQYSELLKTDLIAVADLKNRQDIKINNFAFPKDKVNIVNKRRPKP